MPFFARFFFLLLSTLITAPVSSSEQISRQPINAVGIPLADHYAGIVAYEKYREKMQHADYRLRILPGPDLVRRYFRSFPETDLAFNVSPMVMDMFASKPDFRWVSLIHRDGNALAINHLLADQVSLSRDKKFRLPDNRISDAIKAYKNRTGKPVEIAIPSPLATHTSILYKYLKEHKLTFGFRNYQTENDVILKIVKPPKSPVFLKSRATRSLPAAFAQSLPWAEVAESQGFGTVGWYSKDVLNHEHGHVECIIIARDSTINNKREALKEVIHYIHQAGRDIEKARLNGGEELEAIIRMVHRHIPSHTPEAIRQSLRSDLAVINYKNLNVDENARSSFKEIMDLAFEAGFIKQKINIDELADKSFSTEVTRSETMSTDNE